MARMGYCGNPRWEPKERDFRGLQTGPERRKDGSVSIWIRPRGTAAPGCPAEQGSAIDSRGTVELRSTGHPGAAVPTWPVAGAEAASL